MTPESLPRLLDGNGHAPTRGALSHALETVSHKRALTRAEDLALQRLHSTEPGLSALEADGVKQLATHLHPADRGPFFRGVLLDLGLRGQHNNEETTTHAIVREWGTDGTGIHHVVTSGELGVTPRQKIHQSLVSLTEQMRTLAKRLNTEEADNSRRLLESIVDRIQHHVAPPGFVKDAPTVPKSKAKLLRKEPKPPEKRLPLRHVPEIIHVPGLGGLNTAKPFVMPFKKRPLGMGTIDWQALLTRSKWHKAQRAAQKP